VTKAARYGIKIYVLTDAVTAYVLRAIIYTGKATYYAEAENVTKMRTVQIVERLIEPFVGSHRTIYIDRFYTSLELVKSMAVRKLYVTGTMIQNHIPMNLRIAKTSTTFRSMRRGDKKSKSEFSGGWSSGWRSWASVLAQSPVSFGFLVQSLLQTTTDTWVE
jgi:Transposase IS4